MDIKLTINIKSVFELYKNLNSKVYEKQFLNKIKITINIIDNS